MTLLILVPLAVGVAMAARRAAARWWRRRVLRRLHPPETAPHSRLRGVRELVGSRLTPRVDIADDVAPTLDELARAVAGGDSLATALEALGPTSARRPFATMLGPALAAHGLGAGLADSLADRADAPKADAAEVGLGLAALELAARHGGRSAASLDRVAAAVRERRAVVAERAVQSAQARLSALVLTLIPAGFACWSAATDTRVRGFLLGSTLGWTCLALGTLLNLAGWMWMRRLIRSDGR